MSFLDSILFLVPGLMAYFWNEKLGVTPPVKPSNLEQTAIGAIFWLPTFMLVSFLMKHSHHDIPSIKEIYNYSDTQLKDLFWFLGYSIISSFIISVLWSYVFYHLYMWLINLIRWIFRKGKLTKKTTVWENMFGHGSDMVVRIKKIGDSDEKQLIGQIEYSPRPLTGEMSLVLTEQSFWEAVLQKGNVHVDRTYINTDKGFIIEELNLKELSEIVNTNPELLLIPRTTRRKRR